MSLQWWKEWQTNNEVNEDVVLVDFFILVQATIFFGIYC